MLYYVNSFAFKSAEARKILFLSFKYFSVNVFGVIRKEKPNKKNLKFAPKRNYLITYIRKKLIDSKPPTDTEFIVIKKIIKQLFT